LGDKIYLDSNEMLRDSFTLARLIYDSGFLPDVLVALWRGGTPIGIAIHEFLAFKGVKCYHTSLKVCSYTAIGERCEPSIDNIKSITEIVDSETKVLIVDDIFDSGATVRAIREELVELTDNVRVATLYYRPEHNITDFTPEYYLKETDTWLVFPHELVDLTPDEIREKDPLIFSICGLEQE
jgi:hypoxanthine phosphoribosyltransferase